MPFISDVGFEEVSGRDGNLGLITLTRPQALNALSQKMLAAINQQLTEWEKANHIKAVVVRAAEGRAFCAGGDIRSLYDRKLAGDHPALTDFFREEYGLTRRIYHYSKPYIALMDGITMGGGVGLSVHASHRIGTDRLLFAMPETGIGFYPDVGATYLFSRLPEKMGYYLGLTGTRLTVADCAAMDLVDYFMKAERFPELIYALADTSFDNEGEAAVAQVIESFVLPVPHSDLLQHREAIEECFSEKTVEKIIAAFGKRTDPWCKETAAILKTKSPMSLKVTLRALQEAEHLDFDEAMDAEFRLTSCFLEGHDFFEGIRAVLVDKDNTPHWKPSKLREVTAVQVKKYFVK